jgi:hypothetical protein
MKNACVILVVLLLGLTTFVSLSAMIAQDEYHYDVLEAYGHVYVLAGTPQVGLWLWCDQYPEKWHRPNGWILYPPPWRFISVGDVAFSQVLPPRGQESTRLHYYFILKSPVMCDPWSVPGLYRWDHDLDGFDRVDYPPNHPDGRRYDRLYRDENDPQVFYVTSPEGIYKLSGSNRGETFEKLPASTKLGDLPLASSPRLPENLPRLPQPEDFRPE